MKFADARSVPLSFTLYVELQNFFVECRMVWRQHNFVGAKFTSDLVPTAGQATILIDRPRDPSGRWKRVDADTTVVTSANPSLASRVEPEDDLTPAQRSVFGKRGEPT